MASWHTEDWLVSQANYWDEVRGEMELPGRLTFHDATLRDGEQSPGVVFTKADKIAIAKQLDKLGVHRIEAGMPAVTAEDFEAIQEITSLGLKSQIFSFSRAMPADVERAVACGVDGVIVEITCGEERLRRIHPSWSIADVVRQSVDAIRAAKAKGLYTVYFPYDTTRADPAFFRELLEQVCGKAKPDAVAVVDTTGSAIPLAIKALVRRAKEYSGGLPVEIHTHNDFGMGIANAMAAVEAGAEVVHGCINGIGERCGNAPLEELVIAAEALYGLGTGINTRLLSETCRLVESLSRVPLAYNKPVSGRAAFLKESGIGIKGALKYPTISFPISAEYVGAKSGIVLGKKSGKDSITVKAGELGISVPEERVEELLQRVKALSIKERRFLTDEEFRAIVNETNATME